jgi:hypothetical protein
VQLAATPPQTPPEQLPFAHIAFEEQVAPEPPHTPDEQEF